MDYLAAEGDDPRCLIEMTKVCKIAKIYVTIQE